MLFGRKPVFWAVGLGHFTVDFFNGIGPLLLAFLSGHVLAMTNTQIGFAISLYSLSGALSQPLCGWLADKTGGRWLGAGGVAWTVSLLMLSLVAAATTGSYVLMLIPYALASLGSGAFHPVGSKHAADTAGDRRASNLALFFLLGQLGLSLGPAIAGYLLDRAATHNALFTAPLGPNLNGVLAENGTVVPILLLSLFALPSVLWMATTIPGVRAYIANQVALPKAQGRSAARPEYGSIALLAVVVTLRSFSNPGVVGFIPLLFQSKGWTPAEYGLVTSFYWLAGGLAGMIFGNLADRYGSRIVIAVSLLVSAPLLFLLPTVEGAAVFVMAIGAGAATGGSHSLFVGLSQRLIPAGSGLSSGLTLGFMFATGAIAAFITGSISDVIGLVGAFQFVAAIMLVTGVLSFFLPTEQPAPRVQMTTAAQPAGD